MPEEIFSIYHGLQWYPFDESLAASLKKTVVEIASRGRTGATALELAATTFSLADRLMDRHESVRPLPKAIVCRPGCPCCCSNQVELSPPEALALGDYVARHFSPTEKQVLLAGITRNLKLRAGKNQAELAAIRPELLCPLLREDSCAAYPARPLFCRAHHSLEVDQCRREFRAEKVTAFEFYSHRYEIILSLQAGLREGCQAIGCQTRVLDHVEALQVLLATTGPEERWMNGEAVF